MIGIMDVRYSDVAEVMEIAVNVLVGWQDAGLHNVTKHVDTVLLCQRYPLASAVHDRPGVDRLVNTIPPSFKILDVEVQFVHFSIDVPEGGTAGSGWPRPTGNERI